MKPLYPTTRFADRTGKQAILILAVTSAAILWFLVAALSPAPFALSPGQGGSDLRLYRSIVTRVHSGESYYDAAGAELRAQGYPTSSLFNWRPPLYAWLLGSLPSAAWGQVLLVLGALLTMLMAFAVVEREGGRAKALATAFLLLGAFSWCVDGDAFFVQELWSGMLITLSICAYAQDRGRLGVAAGLAALFMRELALPYCLIALVFSWRQRRGKETVFWLAGLVCYALYLVGHGLEVARHLTPADRVSGSWIQFGGPSFILATCRMNAFLFRLPSWVSAVCLPLSLLGLISWRGTTGLRMSLTAAAYVAAFAVVGQQFNDYWGLMVAPLLSFGFAWAAAALRDLGSVIARLPKAQARLCDFPTIAPKSG